MRIPGTLASISLAAALACSTLIAQAQTSTPSTTTKKPATAKSASGAKPATAKKPTVSGKKSTASTAAALTTDKQKASYGLGYNLGVSLKRQEADVDADVLAEGLRDALSGKEARLSEEEARAAVMKLRDEVQAKMQAKLAAVAAANKKVGDEFLAQNKAKEGVVTLPSGLEYKILKAGDGPKPTATDTVECNYRGTLIDGKEFDSSYKGGKPVSFPVNGVIKGWTEALQLMPVGSKWQLFIPADLAYGERGAGADIPPNSTLIFEVELLSIKQKQP